MHGQAFATIAASDIERARKWYADTFGFEPVDEGTGGSALYKLDNGTMMLLYPSEFAGTNQATTAGILVDDFNEAAEQIRSKGVEFLDVDLAEGMSTDHGVVTTDEGHKSAWMKDSEGNIIAITEDPAS